MAKILKVATFADGDLITPHEVMRELRTIAGEINGGLDLENLDASDLATHVEVKAGQLVRWAHIKVTDGANANIVNTLGGYGQFYPLPCSATTFMTSDFTSVDGVLTIRASATLDPDEVSPGAGKTRGWTLAIKVDGNIIAETGQSTCSRFSCRTLSVKHIVGAGLHHIVAGIRTHEADVDFNVPSGQLYIRQVLV